VDLRLPPFSACGLWIVLLGVGAAAWVIMMVGDRLRGVKIENDEHHSLRTAVVRLPPLLAMFAVSVFTPLAPGPLFWGGVALCGVALVIYVLAIGAFVKARSGLTTIGIYRLSRNPMYLAIFILFAGFALMAYAAASLTGLLIVATILWYVPITHWSVRDEERYLEGRFGEEFRAYAGRVGRYLVW
jgi:protein-S-isoprenylcysteine O-methyltransferase Ste14